MRAVIPSFAALAVGLAASVAAAAPSQGRSPDREPLELDESFSIRLGNDCRYNARIRGQIRPVKASTPTTEETVVPDLVVNADVQCTDRASLLLTERVTGTGPVTWQQLERTIEDSAEITSAYGRFGCSYAPDFNLSRAGLNLRAVAYRCPIR